MDLKEESLALSSGISVAGTAITEFYRRHSEGDLYELFDLFKGKILLSMIKPNKYTALHHFLAFHQRVMVYVDDIRRVAEHPIEIFVFIERTLKEANLTPNLPVPILKECRGYEHDVKWWDFECDCSKALKDWVKHIDKHRDYIDKLIVHSAFQTLFQDRQFLHDFHSQLANWTEENINYIGHTYGDYLVSKKRFRRQHFPVWLKQAIFYRDKGTCVLCRTDLSRLVRTINKIHIDHIVPLDSYGSNDASNMQLLCSTCNTSKGARSTKTSKMNAPFWNLDIQLEKNNTSWSELAWSWLE
ncbi:HNH endonuclease [Priestia aryabhattai]|uniref:HNH endonuclease n=1 Tax=Priestia aryabhattai TaxID=412384 RepID=UPI002E22CB5B|nr:HNH endonuclease [Priestia aryabhattai]MED4011126.1 HNH endonuclease [Priestia aryabhattai]